VIWVQYGVIGVGVGATFALLGVGIVLVYRASGVLNFAHASLGVACAYLNFELLERFPWMPVGVALVLAMLLGAVLGLLAQRLVFERVAQSSQVVKLIVSFGLAGVIQGAIGLVFGPLGTPNPRGHSLFPLERGLHLGGAFVPWQRVGIIALGLATAVGITLLLRKTDFGVKVRALAQNPLAARLAGIDAERVQRITWALAGSTAGLAAVLILPFSSINPLALSGFQLKALAAGLLGGFVSLPATLAGGLGLGIVQEVLVGAPAPFNGLRSVIATIVIVVLLLVRVERWFVSDQEARAVEGDTRAFSGAAGTLIAGSPWSWLVGLVIVALAVGGLSGFWAFVATRTMIYALLALSLVVLTGWSGQVSLMPGTFAGVGACLTWVLATRLGLPFPLVLPLAALATVPVCAAVGVAALRLRPLYLAVGTLALAGLFEETLFKQRWLANGGSAMTVTRPAPLRGDHVFALTALAVVGALFVFSAAIARSRTGRAIRMVSDNDRAAAAGGANPVKYRLLAFVLSAVYAGVSGVLLAYLLGSFDTAAFGYLVLSLAAFGLAAVGGIRSPLGAVVGAFGFVYLTEIFRRSGSTSDWSSVAVGVALIVAMAKSPDGLVGLGRQVVRPLLTRARPAVGGARA
jgi:branched-subunit amino acid ABC-type transport system permease component